MRKLDHDQIAMCCHSLNGLQVSPEGEESRDKLDNLIREADQLGKASVQMSVERAKSVLNASQRPFTKDEYQRFIDRLVWAINSSPGGRLTDDQKEDMHVLVTDTLNSCARSADPQKLIANRLVVLFEDQLAKLEDARLNFDDFVKRCKGEQV